MPVSTAAGDVRLTAAERLNGYLVIMNMNPVSYKRRRFPPL